VLTSLKPKCRKDDELVCITALFLTEDHQLLIHGYCSKCLKDIYIPIPISELQSGCPGPVDFGDEDLKFLRSLKVCLPETPNATPPLSAT
jgi:hypothetical protein